MGLGEKQMYVLSRTFRRVCHIPQQQTVFKMPILDVSLFHVADNTTPDNTMDRQIKKLFISRLNCATLYDLEGAVATAVCSMYVFLFFLFKGCASVRRQ